MSANVDVSKLFSYEKMLCLDNGGCVVYDNCVLKKKLGKYEPGDCIEQITLALELYLETRDGDELFRTNAF